MSRRIAIAIGDPNGIGPEIAVKAAARAAGGALEPVLVGDAFVIEQYAARFGDGAKPRIEAVEALPRDKFQPGACEPAAGRATVEYVRAAVALVGRGGADAICACPMSETAINAAGIAFSGYAGLLADLTGTPRDKVFLMLAAQGLRIAHVTLHESVQSALARMTPELVTEAGLAAVAAAKRLGVAAPKLGVMGINPHAGEDGLFGSEDERITKPAVAELKRRGIAADGPVGGDLLLSQRRHRSVVWPRQIGMYLAKQLTARSLPEIGRRFGNRDHTTVLHAIRKIEGQLDGNSRLKDELEELKKLLAH